MHGELRFLDALCVLVRHDVEFILVGGVAAILEGAPVSTLDLNVLVRRSDANGEKLLAALTEIGSRYLDPAGRHLVPDREKIATLKLHRLLTNFGPLDVMTSIGRGATFEDLEARAPASEVGGLKLRVLGLEEIIRSKTEAGREKDLAVLPVLRRTLELKRGGSSGAAGPESPT